jgi:dTDP-4-dehydrorhamnose reductase/beta-phosphoglucomutase-like phosphatase (HAD superfamily)
MKVLIAGSKGLLGKTLCKTLETNNIDFIGTYNKNIGLENKECIQIDFFDIINIKNSIKSHNISYVINLIAIRDPDICEKKWNLVYKTNVGIVENLISVCNELKIKLMHISTDYVFDGFNPPYNIDSKLNPLQYYGISKVVSEQRILNMCHSYVILRTPVLYSLESKLIESPVTIIGKNIMNLTNKCKLDDYYIRRPVNCKDLSEYILTLLVNDNIGIYHFYNPNDKYTKYEMGNNICKILNINNIEKIDISSNTIIRPYDTRLTGYENITYNSILTDDIKTIFNKYKIPMLKEIDSENLIFLLDLDGTIISEDIHYLAYKDVLNNYGIDFKKEDYIEATNNDFFNGKCTNYLLEKNMITKSQATTISELKKERLLSIDHEILFIPNFDSFIEKIIKITNKIMIVTNSDINYVNHLKKKNGLLDKLEFITRNDYTNPKPSSDGYLKAMERLNYKEGDVIIGVENSLLGLKAISQVTNHVFGCCYDYSVSNNFDGAYYFNDYQQIINALQLQ